MIQSIIFRYLLLSFLLISPSLQQGNNNGGTVSNTENDGATGSENGDNDNANGNANETCDPYHAICQSYRDGTNTCDPVQTAGLIIVNSPNDTSFFYINEDINVTISYTANVDPRFPESFVSIWYKRHGSNDDYISLGNMTNGTNTRMVQIDNVAAGAYDILVLADNIDATQRNKVGITTSCTPDGWPYSAPKTFKLLERNLVNPYLNPFGPNEAYRISSTTLWIALCISFIILH